MSYDISFKVKVEGIDKYVKVGNCNANIPYNVREIIARSTGLEWKNCKNNGLCVDVIPYIKRGLNELRANPNKYKQYEPDNGWGTVKDIDKFFCGIIAAWCYLEWQDPEIASVATFWIE